MFLKHQEFLKLAKLTEVKKKKKKKQIWGKWVLD